MRSRSAEQTHRALHDELASLPARSRGDRLACRRRQILGPTGRPSTIIEEPEEGEDEVDVGCAERDEESEGIEWKSEAGYAGRRMRNVKGCRCIQVVIGGFSRQAREQEIKWMETIGDSRVLPCSEEDESARALLKNSTLRSQVLDSSISFSYSRRRRRRSQIDPPGRHNTASPSFCVVPTTPWRSCASL